MKTITCTISADDEKLGDFKLDPLMQIRLIADAKVNGLSVPEFIREALREFTLRDDYQGEIYCADEEQLQAVSNELLAQQIN
jgi:hypothetical protein